jgi:hypothetical protein
MGEGMATFNIGSQHASVIQQSELITNHVPVAEVRHDIGALRADVDRLARSGGIDTTTAAEIGTALAEADAATEHSGMVAALRRAAGIITGITALGGIAESINQIIELLTGGP